MNTSEGTRYSRMRSLNHELSHYVEAGCSIGSQAMQRCGDREIVQVYNRYGVKANCNSFYGDA